MNVLKKAKIISEPKRRSTSETYADVPSNSKRLLKESEASDVDKRIDRLIESFDEAEALMQSYSQHVQGLTDLRVSVDDPEVSAALRAIDPKSDGKTMGLHDFLRAVDIMRLSQPTPEVLSTTDDIVPRMGYDSNGNPVLYYANGTFVKPDGSVNNIALQDTSMQGAEGTSASGSGNGSAGGSTNDSQHLPALDEIPDVDPNFLDGAFKRKKCRARNNWLLYLLLNLMMTDDDSLDILTVIKFFLGPIEDVINNNGILHGIFGDTTWMEDLAYNVYVLKASLTCLKPYPVKCYCTESGAKIFASRADTSADYIKKLTDQLAKIDDDIQKTQKSLQNLPPVNILNALFVAGEAAALNITLFNLNSQKKIVQNILDSLDLAKAKVIHEILCNPSESDKVVKAFRNADIYNYLYTKYPNDAPLFLRLLKAFDDAGYVLPDYTNYFLSAEFMSFIDLTQQDLTLNDELLLFVPKNILSNIQDKLIKALGTDKTQAEPIDDIDTMMNNLSKMFNIPYTSGATNLHDQLLQVNAFQQAVDTISAVGDRILEKRLLELGGINK